MATRRLTFIHWFILNPTSTATKRNLGNKFVQCHEANVRMGCKCRSVLLLLFGAFFLPTTDILWPQFQTLSLFHVCGSEFHHKYIPYIHLCRWMRYTRSLTFLFLSESNVVFPRPPKESLRWPRPPLLDVNSFRTWAPCAGSDRGGRGRTGERRSLARLGLA